MYIWPKGEVAKKIKTQNESGKRGRQVGDKKITKKTNLDRYKPLAPPPCHLTSHICEFFDLVFPAAEYTWGANPDGRTQRTQPDRRR
jgi:hypothetical protein